MTLKNSPTVLTIFGASGDLATLKLYPSIYNLFTAKLLPDDFKLFGFSRKAFDDEEFRKLVRESIKTNYKDKIVDDELAKFIAKVSYHQGEYTNKADFEALRQKISSSFNSLENLKNLNYLSVPPFVFRDIIQNLSETRKTKTEDIRLIIEKPFGEDEQSAQNLFHFVNMHFPQDKIYLLDHYLGKLAVQSLLHIRRTNRILNTMLQGTEIANIQITAHESLGVEERVGYFESVGIIKDFVHSHLLQILALVTMNIPTSKSGMSLSREKYSILSALKYEPKADNLVLAQYESYASHDGVAPDSKTETYAAIKLGIDLEEWYNVPIYIRVGKKLDKLATYVVIELERYAFQNQYHVPMNRVIFKLQPDQQLIVKIYNQFLDGTMHEIDLNGELLCDSDSNLCEEKYKLTPYATLLKDIIAGERLFFIEFQEVLASWRIIDQVIAHKNSGGVPMLKYSDHSAGPEYVDKLAEIDGFSWLPY